MNKTIFFLFFIFSCILHAQNKNLTCLDFTKGEFKSINDDNATLSSIIIRNGQKQLEITNQEYTYKKIHWLNDCDYSLFFSKKDSKKDPFKKYINHNGGIIVKMVKIENDILYYKTSYFDGKKEVTSSGKLIKISNNSSFN
ncbi:hypothetical protein [Apibacter adventoris]|uniref:hypothetical protein n=1 Tax=Apibacter adventoris TaxID=1679466 RepID=UPI000CF5EDAA|nr:hypothetical protein [Apibacter adventoris]PQL93566.1 hypothetical protein C4S76_07935 [Apibacter adventoris]